MPDIKLFESKKIRNQWSAEEEKWYFSIVDIVGALMRNIKNQLIEKIQSI